jgi:hypothetical protein
VIAPHVSAVVTAFTARNTFCGDGSQFRRCRRRRATAART